MGLVVVPLQQLAAGAVAVAGVGAVLLPLPRALAPAFQRSHWQMDYQPIQHSLLFKSACKMRGIQDKKYLGKDQHDLDRMRLRLATILSGSLALFL